MSRTGEHLGSQSGRSKQLASVGTGMWVTRDRRQGVVSRSDGGPQMWSYPIRWKPAMRAVKEFTGSRTKEIEVY